MGCAGCRGGAEQEEKRRRAARSGGGCCINDNEDLLAEILSRLDGRSLGVAACVCRLWCALSRGDAMWERLCVRHAGGGVGADARAVVVALGGYRRLYRACVGPVLDRKMGRADVGGGGAGRPAGAQSWTRDEAQLSLSLFSIDCYERLGGKRSSLMFLCPAR